MSMKGRLRVILWKDCYRSCLKCMNKQFDLDAAPAVETWEGWSEVVLTGGEPLMYPSLVHEIIDRIRFAQGDRKYPIYLYTSIVDLDTYLELIPKVEGMTVTLYNDVTCMNFCDDVLRNLDPREIIDKSMRINIFKNSGVHASRLLENEHWVLDGELIGWQVDSEKEWVDDYKVDEDVTIRRLF